MYPTRMTGAAAVLACGVNAGTMASSNGSARVVPTPRRNVRRGSASFVTTMVDSLLVGIGNHHRRRTHLEGRAVDDAQDQARKAIVVLLSVARNAPDDRCVV